jgi:hypothetical protein
MTTSVIMTSPIEQQALRSHQHKAKFCHFLRECYSVECAPTAENLHWVRSRQTSLANARRA